MKAAGITHGVAVFSGRVPVDRASLRRHQEVRLGPRRLPHADGKSVPCLKAAGLAESAPARATQSPKAFYRSSHQQAWDRICGRHRLSDWLAKAKTLVSDPGAQLAYFDTLVVQLAPCLDPSHPSTIEQNQQARLEILQRSRDLGLIVGSGEGTSPTWALPGLDFFEGEMSLRTYADSKLKDSERRLRNRQRGEL